MNCRCSKYSPITLDRASIEHRIRDTPSILKELTQLSQNPESKLTLFLCHSCGQHWQDGFAWNFANARYIFQVPDISVEEWLLLPYAQPAAMMIYSAMMEDFFERNTFETIASKCGRQDCDQHAVKFSRFCIDHHIESLQNSRLLPKPPIGRLFPPYHVAR